MKSWRALAFASFLVFGTSAPALAQSDPPEDAEPTGDAPDEAEVDADTPDDAADDDDTPDAPDASGPSPVETPDDSRVGLMLPACSVSVIDVGELTAIFRVELASEGRLTDVCWPHEPCEAPESGWIVRLEYQRCSPDVRSAVLSVQHVGTGRVEAHVVRLDDVEMEARPRSVALAAIELFRRVHIALSVDAPPPIDDETPSDVTVAPAVMVSNTAAHPEPEPPLLRIDLSAAARVLPDLDAGHFGPRLTVSLRLGPRAPVRLRGVVDFAVASVDDPLGEIRTTLLAGALGINAYGRAGVLEVELGPLLELGWMHGTAEGRDAGVSASEGDGFFGTLELSGLMALTLAGPLRGVLELGVGYAFAAATFTSSAGNRVGIAGPVITVALGLGAAL